MLSAVSPAVFFVRFACVYPVSKEVWPSPVHPGGGGLCVNKLSYLIISRKSRVLFYQHIHL